MTWFLLIFGLTTIDQLRLPPETLRFDTQQACEAQGALITDAFTRYARARGYTTAILALCVQAKS